MRKETEKEEIEKQELRHVADAILDEFKRAGGIYALAAEMTEKELFEEEE